MITKLFTKFKQFVGNIFSRQLPRGKVYWMKDHNGWGNRISWSAWPKLRVDGHLYNVPEVGDILVCEFKNSGFLEFQFTYVERCRDPSDQFFANVKYLGKHV